MSYAPDPRFEVLRDQLIALAVDALNELDSLRKSDRIEAAHERGRHDVARSALIALLTTYGEVAEFQAPNTADLIIQSAHRASKAQN